MKLFIIKEPWPSNTRWISKLYSILGAPMALVLPTRVKTWISKCGSENTRLPRAWGQSSGGLAKLKAISKLCTRLCLQSWMSQLQPYVCLTLHRQLEWTHGFTESTIPNYPNWHGVAKCGKQWDISNSNTWTTKNCHRMSMPLGPTWKN